jgi:radical SAM superfamily enzyme YgiQ (UPF0313 family)
MLAQQFDALRVIEIARAASKPVAVGGPDPTSSPQLYAAADFQVLGEAESIIDEFIAAWRRGDPQGRIRSTEIPGRRHQVADPAFRSAEAQALDVYRRAVLARLPVPVQVLRHHRALAGCHVPRPRRRCSPSSMRFMRSAIAAMSISSTTT